jgi:hypothetical protein
VAGGIATTVGVVGDILIPIAWLAPVLMLVAGIGLAASVIGPNVPLINRRGSAAFRSYWGRPLSIALAFCVGVTGVASVLTASSPGGWLGSNVAAVRDVQLDWGLIDARTAQMIIDTGQIKDDLAEIKAKLDALTAGIVGVSSPSPGSQVAPTGTPGPDTAPTLPQVTPDPRRELADLGVSWTTAAFVEALSTSDVRAVELFIRGGMSPDVLYQDSAALLYALTPSVPDPVAVLDVVIGSGFDIDTLLVDEGHLGPDACCFMTDDEQTYAWGSFRGPALLWVVVRASHDVAQSSDIVLIDYLLEHGADAATTRLWLDEVASYMSDYPAFRAARDAVLGRQPGSASPS